MRFNRKSVSATVADDSPAITTPAMKDYLRVSGTGDDGIISAHIEAATNAMKQHLRRAILTETFVFRADGFTEPGGDDRLMALGPGVHTASKPYVLGGGETIDLPFPPLQSVTSIVTYDRANSSSTFSASKYGVDLQSGRVYLHEGEVWPSDLRAQNAVEITYVAGYGSGNIPAEIVEAIKMYVATLYDGSCEGMTAQMMRLVAPYKLMDNLAW